jgi:hypothetical protein
MSKAIPTTDTDILALLAANGVSMLEIPSTVAAAAAEPCDKLASTTDPLLTGRRLGLSNIRSTELMAPIRASHTVAVKQRAVERKADKTMPTLAAPDYNHLLRVVGPILSHQSDCNAQYTAVRARVDAIATTLTEAGDAHIDLVTKGNITDFLADRKDAASESLETLSAALMMELVQVDALDKITTHITAVLRQINPIITDADAKRLAGAVTNPRAAITRMFGNLYATLALRAKWSTYIDALPDYMHESVTDGLSNLDVGQKPMLPFQSTNGARVLLSEAVAALKRGDLGASPPKPVSQAGLRGFMLRVGLPGVPCDPTLWSVILEAYYAGVEPVLDLTTNEAIKAAFELKHALSDEEKEQRHQKNVSTKKRKQNNDIHDPEPKRAEPSRTR